MKRIITLLILIECLSTNLFAGQDKKIRTAELTFFKNGKQIILEEYIRRSVLQDILTLIDETGADMTSQVGTKEN